MIKVFNKILAFSVILVMIATAFFSSAGAEDSNHLEIPFNEYLQVFDSFLEWNDVSKNKETAALFAALIVKDTALYLGNQFDIKSIKKVYVTNVLGFLPGIVVFFPDTFWILYPFFDNITGMPFEGDSTLAELYIYSFEDNGALSDSMLIDTGLFNTALQMKIQTTEDIFNEEGYEGIFRNARSVGAMNCGWFTFYRDDIAGFVNKNGEFLTDDWNYVVSFNEESGTAVVYKGEMSIGSYSFPKSDEATGRLLGNYGLIDVDGKYLLQLEFASISVSDKIATVKKHDGSVAFYNLETSEYTEITGYDYVSYSSDGLIVVFKGTLNEYGTPDKGKYGYVDFNNNIVLPLMFEGVSYQWTDDMLVITVNGKKGVINKEQKLIVPCEWDSISDISEGTAIAVRNNQAYLINLLDGGSTIHAFGTKQASKEIGGYVISSGYGENDHALLDKEFHMALKPIWYSIYHMTGTLFVVTQEKGGQRTSGIYDMQEDRFKTPMIYESISTYTNDRFGGDGMYVVKQSGKWGFINLDFEIAIPIQYEEVNPFNEGFSTAKKDGRWVIIDTSGAVVY